MAACDAELVGKTLQEGSVVFEIREEFYKGFKTDVDEAISLIDQSTIVNLVGCDIVEKAIEKGYVHPDAVLKVCGVLHAQIMKV